MTGHEASLVMIVIFVIWAVGFIIVEVMENHVK